MKDREVEEVGAEVGRKREGEGGCPSNHVENAIYNEARVVWKMVSLIPGNIFPSYNWYLDLDLDKSRTGENKFSNLNPEALPAI